MPPRTNRLGASTYTADDLTDDFNSFNLVAGARRRILAGSGLSMSLPFNGPLHQEHAVHLFLQVTTPVLA